MARTFYRGFRVGGSHKQPFGDWGLCHLLSTCEVDWMTTLLALCAGTRSLAKRFYLEIPVRVHMRRRGGLGMLVTCTGD